MNIELYQQLTGVKIPANRVEYFIAQIKRVQSKLETLLGFTLTPQALYNELGKSQRECVCPDVPEPSSLLPPDEPKGIIKVFPYNHKDKFLHIDPFRDVYAVKLVKVLDNRDFVTYKTFESFTEQYMTQGIGKYIEKCDTCFCDCDCKDCVQLAVDGNWLALPDLPDDLLYLWCDMIDYYADPTKDIKSESVDGHSWSKGDVTAPEATDEAKLLLLRYAGPFGSVTRMPTI